MDCSFKLQTTKYLVIKKIVNTVRDKSNESPLYAFFANYYLQMTPELAGGCPFGNNPI